MLRHDSDVDGSRTADEPAPLRRASMRNHESDSLQLCGPTVHGELVRRLTAPRLRQNMMKLSGPLCTLLICRTAITRARRISANCVPSHSVVCSQAIALTENWFA
jgi:hypothetical protein